MDEHELNRQELLEMISKLAAAAAAAEQKNQVLIKAGAEAQTSMTYWIGELNKSQARVKELERQVSNLQSPLADLVRAGKEGA